MPLHGSTSKASPRSNIGPAAVTGAIWLALACTAALGARALAGGQAVAWIVALLTLFVAGVVASFSRRHMRADPAAAGFFWRLAALVAAVLATLAAGSLSALGAAWCASGWLLASLIGHRKAWPEARAAARRARLGFLAGDTALLGALALLGGHGGSDRIAVALAAVPTLPPAQATAIATLLVIAAAARAALPPFSGWLLASMTAPTPVSALMHAGLVNAGGFLLIRFSPVLAAAPAARALAIALGAWAALYGVGVMMVRPDLKRALAGSTVSQMGFMVLSCGLGLPGAALWHLVGHGLFKAWLFLGSGSAVGMKPPRAPVLPARATLVLAVAAFLLAVGLWQAGALDPTALPLLLAGLTGLATLPALLGGAVPGRVRLALLLGIALLALLHAAGLRLAGQVAGQPAPATLLPDWVSLVLLALFLGGWAWQQWRLAGPRGLPLPLYVHLVNAGALASPGAGDR